jgi:hypothetical protein
MGSVGERILFQVSRPKYMVSAQEQEGKNENKGKKYELL